MVLNWSRKPGQRNADGSIPLLSFKEASGQGAQPALKAGPTTNVDGSIPLASAKF